MNSMSAWCRSHPLAVFILISYLGSWVLWSPMWLSQNGLGLIPVKLSFGEVALWNQAGLFAGPFLAAFLVSFWLRGRRGVRELWSRMFHWKAHPATYVVSLVGVPLVIICAYVFIFGVGVAAGSLSAVIPLY
ncbi:MAG: hypothetical protein Q4A92_07465, partial [Corynebacterium sp.]|nr:hypothetical protein [Corynebacterium sp.]